MAVAGPGDDAPRAGRSGAFGRRARWLAVPVLGLAVLGGNALLANRSDPAAVPGVKIATVLLLEADGGLAARTGAAPDAGQRAERAATVAEVWVEEAQPARLAEVMDAPVPAGPVYFEVTAWQSVQATPRTARVRLTGYFRHGAGVLGPWTNDPAREYVLELARQDPVGATRGWRFVSIG